MYSIWPVVGSNVAPATCDRHCDTGGGSGSTNGSESPRSRGPPGVPPSLPLGPRLVVRGTPWQAVIRHGTRSHGSERPADEELEPVP